MEKLNKNGNKSGMHGNQARGSKHPRSKGWFLYKHDELVGYFASIGEISTFVRKSSAYLWQLHRGKHLAPDGTPKYMTQEGFHIKPAQTIEYVGNK